jgi:hypothetical protein
MHALKIRCASIGEYDHDLCRFTTPAVVLSDALQRFDRDREYPAKSQKR